MVVYWKCICCLQFFFLLSLALNRNWLHIMIYYMYKALYQDWKFKNFGVAGLTLGQTGQIISNAYNIFKKSSFLLPQICMRFLGRTMFGPWYSGDRKGLLTSCNFMFKILKFYSSMLMTVVIFYNLIYLHFALSLHTLNKLLVNIFTFYVIIQYYFIASVYFDVRCNKLGYAKACPPLYSHVYYFGLVYRKQKKDFN